MNCTHCQKPTAASARRCVHCHHDLGSKATEVRTALVRCLACACDMEVATLGTIEVDICPRCAALWLDRGELESLAPEHGTKGRELMVGYAKSIPARVAAYVKCPVCEDPMVRRTHPHAPKLRLATCSSHGVWFEPRDALLFFEMLSAKVPKLAAHSQPPPERVARVHVPPELPINAELEVEFDVAEWLGLFDLFD